MFCRENGAYTITNNLFNASQKLWSDFATTSERVLAQANTICPGFPLTRPIVSSVNANSESVPMATSNIVWFRLSRIIKLHPSVFNAFYHCLPVFKL